MFLYKKAQQAYHRLDPILVGVQPRNLDEIRLKKSREIAGDVAGIGTATLVGLATYKKTKDAGGSLLMAGAALPFTYGISKMLTSYAANKAVMDYRVEHGDMPIITEKDLVRDPVLQHGRKMITSTKLDWSTGDEKPKPITRKDRLLPA